MYRQQDLDLVLKIKQLLYDEGFTIAGARRHLGELAVTGGQARGITPRKIETDSTIEQPVTFGPPTEPVPIDGATAELNRKTLLELRDALRDLLTLLERK
jgi:DNA-binding transcriptional MerR regulator